MSAPAGDAPSLLPGLWTEDPQARALLATCAASPPPGAWQRTVYVLTTDEHYAYRGPRVNRLRAIADAYLRQAIAAKLAGDATGFENWRRCPDVDTAIACAINRRPRPAGGADTSFPSTCHTAPRTAHARIDRSARSGA